MDNLIRFRSAKKYWRDGTCAIAQPAPAKASAPAWYRKMARSMPLGPKHISMTIKMCPPFQEALYQGYVIPVPFDVSLSAGERSEVRQELEEGADREWQLLGDRVDGRLLSGSPWEEGVYRLQSFWLIETPPGFSCLLITPLARAEEEAPLEILPSVIASDEPGGPPQLLAALRGNLPVKLKRGTPLVQVIPFERSEWSHQLSIWDQEKVGELVNFRGEYWDIKNRKFDENADPSDPQQGWGAYHKLVKAPTRFR